MKITLETRQCICGCKKTFRVLPTSKNVFFSKFHAYISTNKPGNVGKLARSLLSNFRANKFVLRRIRKARQGIYIPETEFIEHIEVENADSE
jgi:hypothetical protein